MAPVESNQTLVENLEVAIILLDQKSVVRKVNVATETLFQKSRRYLIGCHFSDLIGLPLVKQCVRDCLSESAKFTLRELAVEQAEGELLLNMTISPAGGTMGSEPCVLIEINSVDRSAQYIKESHQLERQQSFRQMMRGLAHEIKNPLGGLRGAAQLLERETTRPEHLELTKILIKETDRLSHLVDRVMGSQDQLNLTVINIHEVLEHVIELARVGSVNQSNFIREYDPTLPEITVDKEQLIQAVLNIVINALQAQRKEDQNAVIGIVTRFERFVTINQKTHRKVLKIMIWDEGPGVAVDLLDSLFDPLVTDRPEGSGLGLSITQEIIQRHEGQVMLEDHDGRTCFSIYLPYKLDSGIKNDNE
jgi:two-component system nitrogen regulation sensor histidine kinase GlnL